jgi:hypothetical protein
MKLKIIFKDSNYIEITMFDETSVTQWFQHFNMYNDPLNYGGKVFNDYTVSRPATITDVNIDANTVDVIKYYWKIVKDSLNSLADFEVPTVPNSFDFDQTTLNTLKRFYTSGLGRLPSDIIGDINRTVTRLSQYTLSNSNRVLLKENFPITDIWIHNAIKALPISTNPRPVSPMTWTQFSPAQLQQNYKYLDMDTQNLVLLDFSIPGKTILQSFFDNDDPSQFDCTGRTGSFGGFFVESNDNRRKLYKSTEFVNWIESHGLDPVTLPYEFPIGYVSDSSQAVGMFLTAMDQFDHLEFIE